MVKLARQNVMGLLSNLRGDTGGNVLVLTASSMPLLLGALALGIDTFQIALHNRELQRAADSAALAGAYAIASGQNVRQAAEDSLQKNPHTSLVSPATVVTEPWGEHQRTVRVDLAADPNLPFMAFFTDDTANITVTARAALAGTQERYCMYSLYNGTSTGMEMGGSIATTLDCGVTVNSSSKAAISFSGGATLEATVVAAVGDLDGGFGNFVPPTRLAPYSVAQNDPLAHLPNPPALPNNCKSVVVKAMTKSVLTPGCYSMLDISGDATFLPGTYYINGGDLVFGSKSRISGFGVSIVLTGSGGAAGDVKWDGGAIVNLSSSALTDFPGVLFYRDRRAANKQLIIAGNPSLKLTGAIYFPSSDIKMVGNGKLNVVCLQLIGQQLKVYGNLDVTSECPDESGASPFRSVRVRMVS